MTSETKHTPDPWEVGTSQYHDYCRADDPEGIFQGIDIFGPKGELLAIVPCDPLLGEAQVDATAALIAAVPVLLVAADQAFDFIYSRFGENEITTLLFEAIKQAGYQNRRAAITPPA